VGREDPYADGVAISTLTRALQFGYPARTRSVGVHFKPWGLAPFLALPAAELRDRPVTVEQLWGRPAAAELTERPAAAAGPRQMLALLERALLRRLRETAGLDLVRDTTGVIAASAGAVAIGELQTAAGVSSTLLARRFKEVVGMTPKRLARVYRFAATVSEIDPSGRSTGSSSPPAPATTTRRTSATTSGRSRGSSPPATSMSAAASWTSTPATP